MQAFYLAISRVVTNLQYRPVNEAKNTCCTTLFDRIKFLESDVRGGRHLKDVIGSMLVNIQGDLQLSEKGLLTGPIGIIAPKYMVNSSDVGKMWGVGK